MDRPSLNDRESSVLDYRMAKRYARSNSTFSDRYDHNYRNAYPDLDHDHDPSSPPHLSSPSQASSVDPFSAAASPFRRDLSRTTVHDESDNVSSPSKIALARRLSHLAQQLTCDDDVDEQALTSQIDHMEKFLTQRPPSMGAGHPVRPRNLDRRSQSDQGGLLLGPSLPLRGVPEYPDVKDIREWERETQEGQPAKGMSQRQVNKIVAEATKLNEELSIVVSNLQARQEESDHIHELLIERAERAAQRIIFLQNRISYLEDELRENDDELQHLRICLKAVEVQMPPHPDPDIQRCISTFKKDYQALKKKRANRSSLSSFTDHDTTTTRTQDYNADVTASPLR